MAIECKGLINGHSNGPYNNGQIQKWRIIDEHVYEYYCFNTFKVNYYGTYDRFNCTVDSWCEDDEDGQYVAEHAKDIYFVIYESYNLHTYELKVFGYMKPEDMANYALTYAKRNVT